MDKFKSRKLFATLIAVATALIGWASGSMSPAEAISNIGVIAIAYAGIQGAVDIALAQRVVHVAKDITDAASAVLAQADKVLDEAAAKQLPE